MNCNLPPLLNNFLLTFQMNSAWQWFFLCFSFVLFLILAYLPLTNTVLAKIQSLIENFPQKIRLDIQNNLNFRKLFPLYFWCTGIFKNIVIWSRHNNYCYNFKAITFSVMLHGIFGRKLRTFWEKGWWGTSCSRRRTSVSVSLSPALPKFFTKWPWEITNTHICKYIDI